MHGDQRKRSGLLEWDGPSVKGRSYSALKNSSNVETEKVGANAGSSGVFMMDERDDAPLHPW